MNMDSSVYHHKFYSTIISDFLFMQRAGKRKPVHHNGVSGVIQNLHSSHGGHTFVTSRLSLVAIF